MKRKLKVLKKQESVKNTTVPILYKEDLKKTKMVREHISLINDIKEEKEKKKKWAYKELSKNNSDIDDFFFVIFVGINAGKKVFRRSIRTWNMS